MSISLCGGGVINAISKIKYPKKGGETVFCKIIAGTYSSVILIFLGSILIKAPRIDVWEFQG